jgi:hypothetical protein
VKRLVLFTEGKGDRDAGVALASRVLRHVGGEDYLFVDPNPINAQNVGWLLGNEGANWRRTIRVAGKRKNTAGVLLLLDGDLKSIADQRYVERSGSGAFCAAHMASHLAALAVEPGAGHTFSLAVVFACCEFESWIAACIDRMAGAAVAQDRARVPADVEPLPNPDTTRDAKGWLKREIGEYRPTLDQAALARHIDIEIVEQRSRSFRRLVNAMRQIVDAVRSDRHIVTPRLRH